MGIIEQLDKADQRIKEKLKAKKTSDEERRSEQERKEKEQMIIETEKRNEQKKRARKQKISEVLDSEEKGIDDPFVYDVITERDSRWTLKYGAGGIDGRVTERTGTYIGTKRKLQLRDYLIQKPKLTSIRPFSKINYVEEPRNSRGPKPDIVTIQERAPYSEQEKAFCLLEKRKNEMIENVEDPFLDQKGRLYFIQIDGTIDSVETTVRKALRALGNESFEKNFKTNKQIEAEKREKELEERPGISLRKIKKALRVLKTLEW